MQGFVHLPVSKQCGFACNLMEQQDQKKLTVKHSWVVITSCSQLALRLPWVCKSESEDWGKQRGQKTENKPGDDREKPRWCKKREREGHSKRNWYGLNLLTKDIEIKIFPDLKVSIRFMRMRLHFFGIRRETWRVHHRTAAEGLCSAPMRHLCC